MSNFGSEWVAEIVWNPKKQSMLIDSMYRGFYIPPVVFSIHWDEKAEAKVRLCVDGKQRLTAISGFVSGRVRIPLLPLTRTRILIPLSSRSHVRVLIVLPPSEDTKELTLVVVRCRSGKQKVVLVQATKEEKRDRGTQ